jgi:hypothetical protein
VCFRASRSKNNILFKLTNCQTRSFRSYFQSLCRHPDQVLQLFNFVVSRFHLNDNFFLDLDQIHFSLGKQCPRVVDLGVVLSPIEEVVRESESKDAKVVNEERNSTLITVSSQPGDVGDMRPLSSSAIIRSYICNLCVRAACLASSREARLSRTTTSRAFPPSTWSALSLALTSPTATSSVVAAV